MSNVSPGDLPPYSDLLTSAHDAGLRSMETQILALPGNHNNHQAVVCTTVALSFGTFSAVGEAIGADESTGELLERAENRAKARALTDALGSFPPAESSRPATLRRSNPSSNGGQRNGRSTRRASKENRGSDTNHNGTRTDSHNAMTSAQRRFLFRLVCEQGVDAKDADAVICEVADEQDLADISRRKASQLIDGLQSGEVQIPVRAA